MKKSLKNTNKKSTNYLRIASLVLVMIGIYYFIPKLGTFKNTFSVLRDSSWFWLTIAFGSTVLSFFAAGYTQFAAGNLVGTIREITLVQTAGSFINHFLPFNIGGVNLISKYYIKRGVRSSEAIVVSLLPILFGILTTVLTIAVISPITITNYINHVHKTKLNQTEIIVVGLILIASLLLVIFFKDKIRGFIKEAVSGLRSINNLKQVINLSLGSILITLSSTFILYCAIKAINQPVNLIAIFTLYVTSSLVSNLAPTPGGLGAVEAFLLVGLAATHLSFSQAAAVILIYRFFTFWLPILPGAIAFHIVNKSKLT